MVEWLKERKRERAMERWNANPEGEIIIGMIDCMVEWLNG
jgi:hypothetical protein